MTDASLKLGKRPAVKDDRDLLFARYRMPSLKEAPIGFGHTGMVEAPWGMLANDSLGDCAIAGPMHETMLLNAEAGRQISFTDTDAITTYSAITGYIPGEPQTDQGSNVRDVLNYRAATGLTDATGCNHKIGAFVALTPGDWIELLEALFVFECVGIGIQVPESAMQQFQQAQPWAPVTGSPIEGGHYVPVVAHPADDLATVVTWGALQQMTEAFYREYNDESFAFISEEDLTAGATLEGFDLEQLQADLGSL